jgi:hypothetical protein
MLEEEDFMFFVGLFNLDGLIEGLYPPPLIGYVLLITGAVLVGD